MQSAAKTDLKVDHAGRRAQANWTGTFDMQAIASSCQQREEEGAHEYALLVHAEGAEIARSLEDTRKLARTVQKLVDQSGQYGAVGPTAIIVNNMIDFGMCRMIAAYFEPAGKIGVF